MADQIRAEQGLPPCTEPPSAADVLELVLELVLALLPWPELAE